MHNKSPSPLTVSDDAFLLMDVTEPLRRMFSRMEAHFPWYSAYRRLIMIIGPHTIRRSPEWPSPDEAALTEALDALAQHVGWKVDLRKDRDGRPIVREALIDRARAERSSIPQVKRDVLRAALREALEALAVAQFQRRKRDGWWKDRRGERWAFVPLHLHPRLAERYWHALSRATIRAAEADLLGGTFSLAASPPPDLSDALAVLSWAKANIAGGSVWVALPPGDKELLILASQGCTSRAIGSHLGMSPGNVRLRKLRLLQKLHG